MRAQGGCAILLGVWILSACESGYQKYYSDESFDVSGQIDRSAAVYAPQIFTSTGDPTQDEIAMFEDGFVRIGSAGFIGPLEDEDGLIEQAKKVGAQRVIVSQEFSERVSTSVPITTTQAVTTYHSGTASAYGTGGRAFGSYSGTSTSFVPQTTYIPMAVDRYEQNAVFYAKMTPSCLGFLDGDLTDEDKQRIGTNVALKITAIREDSPFYRSDVVPGDIILAINGGKPSGDTLKEISSNTIVDVVIDRLGERLRKSVRSGQCQS